MKIIRKTDVPSIEDPCGQLKELYNSNNISIAHVVVSKISKKHKHNKLEEVYFITRGTGIVGIGNKEAEVKTGDTIPIPKNTWHYLKPKGKPFELLAITNPKYDPKDMILEE